MADRAFPNADAVGKIINLADHDYRVIGVLRPWNPTPHFVDLDPDPRTNSYAAFSDAADFYMPFSTAVDQRIHIANKYACYRQQTTTHEEVLSSNCVWIRVWVELQTPAQVRDFKDFLHDYAVEQQRLGRFQWAPRVELRDVNAWLAYSRVVPDQDRVNALIAAGFLVVCLVNVVGLMLAKFSGRATELSVRRALGASRSDLFLQCVTEALLIGLLGAVLGVALTGAGLALVRHLGTDVPNWATDEFTRLAVLDRQMILITVVASIAATVCSGLYPAFEPAACSRPGS